MRFHVLAVLTTGLTFAGEVSSQDLPKKDFDKLQGTWQVVSLEREGKQEDPEGIKNLKLVIKGGTYTLQGGEEAFEGTFILDPTSKPKRMDTKGAKIPRTQGIYDLKGDGLKICWAEGDTERPREFATKPDSNLRLIVLKREKK